MKCFLSCICCCILLQAFSQDSIIVRKDGRLDLLNARQASLNKMAARFTSTGLVHGYRLQVLSTQNREQAYQVKSELLQRFPEQKAYTSYQSPYFKVRFGNFTDRTEALRYKNLLSSLYPQGVYIIQDDVEYTPPKEEDTGNP